MTNDWHLRGRSVGPSVANFGRKDYHHTPVYREVQSCREKEHHWLYDAEKSDSSRIRLHGRLRCRVSNAGGVLEILRVGKSCDDNVAQAVNALEMRTQDAELRGWSAWIRRRSWAEALPTQPRMRLISDLALASEEPRDTLTLLLEGKSSSF